MMDLKRNLVPLDGSSLAEKALPMATALAQKAGSQIILLRVLRFFMIARGGYQAVFPYERPAAYNDIYQEAERYLQTQQDKLQRHGIDTHMLLCPASPGKDVVDIIVDQNVDLIVMATHGLAGLLAVSPMRWYGMDLAPCYLSGKVKKMTISPVEVN